jgi:hypothetical protein
MQLVQLQSTFLRDTCSHKAFAGATNRRWEAKGPTI